jgi:hypothetical protein
LLRIRAADSHIFTQYADGGYPPLRPIFSPLSPWPIPQIGAVHSSGCAAAGKKGARRAPC